MVNSPYLFTGGYRGFPSQFTPLCIPKFTYAARGTAEASLSILRRSPTEVYLVTASAEKDAKILGGNSNSAVKFRPNPKNHPKESKLVNDQNDSSNISIPGTISLAVHHLRKNKNKKWPHGPMAPWPHGPSHCRPT